MFDVWWLNNIEINNKLNIYEKDLARALKEYFIQFYFCKDQSFNELFKKILHSNEIDDMIKEDIKFFSDLLLNCYMSRKN